jgi:Na+(H+)/acetate symporter ActP
VRRGLDERARAFLGRAFVIGATLLAYWIAMTTRMQIFEIGVQFASTGYAAMLPVVVSAAWWKRSTRQGALASTRPRERRRPRSGPWARRCS